MDLGTTYTVMREFPRSASDFLRKIHWPTRSTAENATQGAKIVVEVPIFALLAQMASVWWTVVGASLAWKIAMSVQRVLVPVGSAPMDFS
jgi:hypothetical protein